MPRPPSRLTLAVLATLSSCAPALAGGCDPEWSNDFAIPSTGSDDISANGAVHALLELNLGGESILIAAGEFTVIGGVAANRIALYLHGAWIPLTGGLDGPVYALALHDDGSGERLYVGGAFANAGGTPAANIARWDGGSWSALGAGFNAPVRAMQSFTPQGQSARLIAAGDFLQSGATSVPYIAQWNGAHWSAMQFGLSGRANALAVYDDGAGGGEALYVGGEFEYAGAIDASSIARWNGATWSALGGGVAGVVHALTVFNNDLYVGGSFAAVSNPAARHIARWDGAAWSALGAGLTGSTAVRALAVHDDGSGGGEDLYVGGVLTLVNGMDLGDVARWDGAAWSAVGLPVGHSVYALASAAYENGVALWAGGNLGFIGENSAERLAVFANGAWTGNAGSGSAVVNAPINVIAATVEDGVPVFYASGPFTAAAGATNANRIARWNGLHFESLGAGLNAPAAVIIPRDDGLYVGGLFTQAGGAEANYIARWNGAAWENFAPGLGSDVFDMRFHDFGEGERLVVGGFVEQSKGPALNHIAIWDGAAWQPLGDGVSATVSAVEVFDGDLYIGGLFPFSGSTTVNSVARWNVDHWEALQGGLALSPLGGPFPSIPIVSDMLVFDGELFVAGHFDQAGNIPVSNVARWDGVAWSDVGGGVPFLVNALAIHDDGNGPALYAAGARLSNTLKTPVLARWDSSAWDLIDTDLTPSTIIATIASGVVSARNSLLVGGSFQSIGGVPSPYLSALLGCDAICLADLDGDNFVGFADLNVVLSHFNQIGENIPGDIDDDGQVGFADLNIVLSQYNVACE